MDKHIFRSFIIAVTSSDEFDDSVTHVAVELRPSAILYLVIASLLAWLIRKLIGWLHFYHLEISFRGTTWLNFNLDADYPEDWEEGALVDEIDPALIAEARLIGHSAQVTGTAACGSPARISTTGRNSCPMRSSCVSWSRPFA